MKQYLKNNIFLIFSTIVIFVSISFLVYKQIFTDTYASDTQEHLIFMYSFLGNHPALTYPLWHLSGIYLSKLIFIPFQYGAIAASAFYVTFWFLIIFIYTSSSLSTRYNNNFKTLISLFIFIIAPLCIPWYSHAIFIGQGSPNIWHNVTLWTVKPFALLSVWFILDGIEKEDSYRLWYGVVFTIISIFAKPSFIIMFLPALLLYALAKHIYTKRSFIISYTVLALVSISILLYQYSHTFNHEEGKIIIDFLGVWSLSSPNIPISIALALAFPLSFTMLKLNILEDKYILISWIMTFISILYYSVFAQSGRFYTHGNFGWSYMIAMSLLYLFSIVKFFEIYKTLYFLKRYILLILLVLQTMTGIYYFTHVLMGQNPLYIGIFL